MLFVRFWLIDTPMYFVGYFSSINSAFLQLFSLPLLVKTYFKPWKNEYRKDFVPIAILIGVVIKTCVIFVDLVLFVILLAAEAVFIFTFMLWPLGTILLFLLSRGLI